MSSRIERPAARPERALLLSALLITLPALRSAPAAELIVNGGFDQDIQGWTIDIAAGGSPMCVHSAKSVGDDAASSGAIGCSLVAPGVITVDGDCFPIAADETYVWRADALVGGAPSAFADVNLITYQTPDCTSAGAYWPVTSVVGSQPWQRGALLFVNGSFNQPQAPQSARAELRLAGGSGTADGTLVSGWFDNVSLTTASFDAADPFQRCSVDVSREALCLNRFRFRVAGTWHTVQGQSGVLHGMPLTDDAGVFYFTNPKNLELNVKVLDACALNGHYWVFIAGSTNVGIALQVTDLATGATRAYTNTAASTFVTVTDTSAFDCP